MECLRLCSTLLVSALLCTGTSEKKHLDYEEEYRVKAACLYGFAKYVEWPKTDTSQQFTIGILGKDLFGDTLEKIVQQKNLNGRPVVIRRLRAPELARECEIVFVGSPEMVPNLVRAVGHSSVLTVSDSPGFTEMGGMIGFVIVDGNVRFDIDAAIVSKAGLTASARLLQLARKVTPETQVHP